jgi:hypothetical protein
MEEVEPKKEEKKNKLILVPTSIFAGHISK